MESKDSTAVHWSFWLITTLMLVWNVMGCMNFIMQMNPDTISSYRETEQAIITGRPIWATIGFFIAVFGGAFGCLLLMLKQSVSFYLLIASLLGVVIAIAHTLSIDISFGIGEIVGIILMPLLVAGFLVWYAKYVDGRGWLKKNKSSLVEE